MAIHLSGRDKHRVMEAVSGKSGIAMVRVQNRLQ